MAQAVRETVPTAAEIFRKYASRVYHLVRRMLGNDADAEDATQEVFLHVIRKLPSFRGEAAFPTWLYRVAVNTALAYRRKRAVREEHRIQEPLDDFQVDGAHGTPVRRWEANPAQEALDHERQLVIEAAIAQLPATYRDVYLLADVEGLDNPAVSEVLGLSLPTVKSRLHRARLLLRKTLAPYFEGSAA